MYVSYENKRTFKGDMSYSLNSLKGVYRGFYRGRL